LDIFERDQLLEHVRGKEGEFRAKLETLADLDIVGEIRGTGFFYGIELVKDKNTRETFSDDESERLLRGILTPKLFELGLICRADDRGDPVVQLSPPLVCESEQFDEMVAILREAFEAAQSAL
jgi:adenosylmethionine-8-amino-7-oxononanoate aminotransferase